MAIQWGDLMLAAQTDSDKVGDGSITNQQWMIWARQGVEALYREIVPRDPDLYFALQNFTLTGTEAGAALALNTLNPVFRGIHGVDLNPGTSSRRTVKRRNFEERNRCAGSWQPGIWCTDRMYDIRGGNGASGTLVITPYEVAAGTYRIYYRTAPTVPDPNNVVLTATMDDSLEQWHEFVSEFMTGKALRRDEGGDGSPLTARIAEIRQEIAAAYDRNDQEPASIADVESDGPLYGWGR